MNFIRYDNLIFYKLSSAETILIRATKSTWVESISVCNLADNVSGNRLSLKITKTLNIIGNSKTVFKIRNLLIDKNQSKDLIVYLGNKIFLNNGDSLTIFSGSYHDLFDCTVDFYELNEASN